MKIENTKGYAFYGENMGAEYVGKPNGRTLHTLKVQFILDLVPGAFHQPEDLMTWIAQNPYVASVELIQDPEIPEPSEPLTQEEAVILNIFSSLED